MQRLGHRAGNAGDEEQEVELFVLERLAQVRDAIGVGDVDALDAQVAFRAFLQRFELRALSARGRDHTPAAREIFAREAEAEPARGAEEEGGLGFCGQGLNWQGAGRWIPVIVARPVGRAGAPC